MVDCIDNMCCPFLPTFSQINLSSLEDYISCPVKSDIWCGSLHNRRKVSRSVSGHLEGLRVITSHPSLFSLCRNLRCDTLGALLQPGSRNEEDTQLSCSRNTMGRTKKIQGGISDRSITEQTLGYSERQESLACCSPRGRKESDTTEQKNKDESPQWNILHMPSREKNI